VTPPRLRIGITGYSNAGGSGVVAGELGRLLARRGHSIHFIADAPPFRFASFDENLAYHEVAASCYPLFKYPPYTLALAAKMAEVSRRCELDILHVHYALPHTAAAILARSILGNPARPKLVTTLHGTDVTLVGSEKSLYEITAFSIRASNAVTAVSQFLKQAATEIFPACGQIEVIPNFVDLAAFSRASSADARSRLAAPQEVLLVHLSNFRSVKRPVDTVRILAAVNAQRAARLILIGDGPEIASVRQEADRLGVGDRVQMLGNQLDVRPLLSCCDVFLLPSEEESFGLAALEAMACGVPAVTSDTGGLAELVENGKGGYRVAPGDTDAMAARVLDIVADSDTLEFHRRQARQSAERFDAELIVPMYEALYMRTLA
jgi:N-acetyl-alpha-D-glucosaminyl L-malate synthase BshA